MAPFNRRPIHNARAVRSLPSVSQPGSVTGPRVGVTVASAVCAGVGWSIARLFVPERFIGLVAFCAVWIALYPAARSYAGGRAVGHWLGGAVVVLVWLLTLFIR
jgi:hypothetical protein